MTNYAEILEENYQEETRNECNGGSADSPLTDYSRSAYIADHILDIATYDSGMDEIFGKYAVEVIRAIHTRTTFDYINTPHQYQWYLIIVNMPFFKGLLNWGGSIRGAWWDSYDGVTIDTCGMQHNGDCKTEHTFTEKEWTAFIDTLLEFADKG